LENVDKAAQETKRFLSRVDAEQHAFQVVLLLREALANAVLDGSELNADNLVACTIRLAGDDLIMEIEDEGEGFDWRRHLGKEPPPGAESGRGLAIMEKYCEEVVFNDTGNKLTLKKSIRLAGPY
jgi:serine/threonine-protein kinase RsbW